MQVEMVRRNATLEDVAELLRTQQGRKVDFVAPASKIEMKGGLLHVEGMDVVIDEEGVTPADGRYVPTAIFDEGVADKLKIPLAYMRRMRAERPDLIDANVNGWLHGQVRVTVPFKQPGGLAGSDLETILTRTKARQIAEADSRKFLLRCFGNDEPGGYGVGRALLSNGYRMIDHIDAVTAALDAVRSSGTDAVVESVDLSERKLCVRVAMPEIQALAPILMAGYRNPFGSPDVQRAINHGWDVDRARAAAQAEGLGYGQGEEPIVFAGLEITNSETGDGALSVTPRLIVKVCRNGLKITQDVVRAVHLGGKLDDGLVRWSDDTQRKSIELVKAKMRDVITTVTDVEYVRSQISRIEEQAGVKVSKPDDLVKSIGKQLAYDESVTASVLDHFIRGGQMTAGGVLNAVTSVAQTIADPDKAQDVEGSALRALALAAAN